MMSHRMISDDGLKSVAGGYAIELRVPWYRSLPVSVFEVLEVSLDGQTVPLDGMKLSLEGEAIPLEELKDRTGDTWYVRDSGYLMVPGQPLRKGGEHDVSVTIAIYPPYIKGYKRITRTDKRLVAR